jgi:hypothetical protein
MKKEDVTVQHDEQGEKTVFSKIKKEVDDFLNEVSEKISEILTCDIISYDEVFKYFIISNKDTRIAKGVLLKEDKGKHILLYQVFLDKDDNIICKADQSPIGRKLEAKQLDIELKELFGTKDMVLVE